MPKSDKPINWAGIERDYRAGLMSIREIARWYDVSEGAIRKKAKGETPPWERKQKPPHLERHQVLSGEIIPPAQVTAEELPERARGIAARLLDELDAITAHLGELEFMIETEESDSRRRQALLKALSTSERAMTLKNITASLKTLAEISAPEGKKAARQQAAEQVGGRFAVPAAPRLAVDNTKK